jgi:hypothetical protein
MVLAPSDRLPTLTDNVAVPAAVGGVAVEATTGAEPSEAVPAENVTVPVGELLPVTAVTVAVNWTALFCATLAGLAVTRVVVPTPGGTTGQLVARL